MNITVYLASSQGNRPLYRQAAAELGSWIGAQGHQLIYGGSSVGLMGVLADAVLSSGGTVIGVEPRFFVESALQHEGIQQLIVVETMAERKAKMMELGDVFVAFPGGSGTLEEISEIISHNSIGLISKPCILYNLDHFYDGLKLLLDHMVQEGFLPAANREKVRFARNITEIVELSEDQWKMNGRSMENQWQNEWKEHGADNHKQGMADGEKLLRRLL